MARIRLSVVTVAGIYTLYRHDVKPGLLEQFMHVTTGVMQNYDYPKPIGIWFSEFGPFHSGMS